MNQSILFAIAMAALVTALMRTVPLFLLARFHLPQGLERWLSFIPAAIMAAIITAEVIAKPVWSPSGLSLSLLATLIAAVAGIVTRSLFLTVIAGMAAMMGLSYVLIS
ncbi:AzlD domain-containing protein [Phytobacter sp. V91]|uniref:AzlD domain-containing protein n=1 Tax=Phytobacter sp. V91 TaxID=3369425 RepID=UPI003F636F5B